MAKSEVVPPETVSALIIMVTVFHALALIITSFRLWYRYHLRRLWWDDFWAAFALLCDAVCMVTVWTLTAPLDSSPYTNTEALPTPAQSRSVHIISYWLSVLFYTCSIWSARLSIVFSLIRIVPPSRTVCVTIFGACGVFVCMWVYILASKAVACGRDRSWYHAAIVQCPVPYWVALSEVCTDIFSDMILVILPFCLLWRVKLPWNRRIMILSVFSTSILVSVVSAVHTSYLIHSASFIAGVTAEMEGAVSLIVCNLLVLVTFIYRVVRNDLFSDPSFPRRPNADAKHPGAHALKDDETASSNRLTTVDLDLDASLFSRAATTTDVGTRSGTRFTGTDVSSVQFGPGGERETTFGSVSASPYPAGAPR